jgi:hypothetical protein
MRNQTNRKRPAPRQRRQPTGPRPTRRPRSRRRGRGGQVAELGDRSTLYFFVILLTLWFVAGAMTWAYVGYAFLGAIVLSLSSWQDFLGLVVLILATVGIFSLL